MTTERIKLNGDERLMIDPEMTLAHAAQVTTMHPRTERLFRIVFPEYDRPVTPADLRTEGLGIQHALGLIDLSLRCMEEGRAFGWRAPKTFLDLPAQNGLADVLAALVANDEANLLDLRRKSKLLLRRLRFFSGVIGRSVGRAVERQGSTSADPPFARADQPGTALVLAVAPWCRAAKMSAKDRRCSRPAPWRFCPRLRPCNLPLQLPADRRRPG